MKIIFDYNRTLFNPETDALYSGVIELLEELSQRGDLCLVSRDEPGRKNKLEELGIGRFFKQIRFVEEKTKELFEDLGGRSRNVFVVGDRMREEIRIGNELGFTTIWIQQGKFATELPFESDKPHHTIQNIEEVEKIITAYEK